MVIVTAVLTTICMAYSMHSLCPPPTATRLDQNQREALSGAVKQKTSLLEQYIYDCSN